MTNPCLSCSLLPATRRGCCSSCYERHRRAIHAGTTTWPALEALGLAAPGQPRGRAWMKGFRNWLAMGRVAE
jgi:hypothetical protein